jgi:hypothetical protein
VTLQHLGRGASAEECGNRSIRIGMYHAFLPNSEAPLCSYFHLSAQQTHDVHESTLPSGCLRLQPPCTPAAGTLYFPPFPTRIPSSLHHIRLDSTFRISCAHVLHPLLTLHSLPTTSFHHAQLGFFYQSRRRTRPRRGPSHPAWLSSLHLRRFWRACFSTQVVSQHALTTNSILFGYDSGYISGVLAMNTFKQQFGSMSNPVL